MKVEHFGGSVEVTGVADLDDVLSARYGDSANEYLMCAEKRYPLLSVQVRGARACLHFFPHEDHPGFLSVADGAGEGVETFYTNTPTEEIQVATDAIIPFDQAKSAAHEFLHSRSISSSVQWTEF
jgi:hypothetical protein